MAWRPEFAVQAGRLEGLEAEVWGRVFGEHDSVSFEALFNCWLNSSPKELPYETLKGFLVHSDFYTFDGSGQSSWPDWLIVTEGAIPGIVLVDVKASVVDAVAHGHKPLDVMQELDRRYTEFRKFGG